MAHRLKPILVLSVVLITTFILHAGKYQDTTPLPRALKGYIKKIDYGRLGALKPQIRSTAISKNLVRISVTWMLKDSLKQDDWQVNFYPDFVPDFHWAPHLTPTDDHIIAQHVFRAPR